MDNAALQMEAKPQQLRVKFHGRGGEYFRIWLVNICLTILTLGIYSAWAKVRKLKYFAGSTELAGGRFDFHGDPIAILKGRLLAVLFFGAYFALASLAPSLSVLLIMLAVPWLFVKSMQFRFRYSSYRNIRFSFRGKVKDAYLLVWSKLWPLALLGLLMALVQVFSGPLPEKLTQANLNGGHVLIILLGLSSTLYGLVVFPKFLARGMEFVFNNVFYGKHKATMVADEQQIRSFLIYRPLGVLGLAFAVFVGCMGLVILAGRPFAMVMAALGVLTFYIGLFLVTLMFPFGLLHHNWSRIQIEGQPTFSSLEFFPYVRVVFVNLLATMFTLGLFTPWAQVRYRKYVLENRGVTTTDLDSFTSESKLEDVSTFGEAVDDVSDFEFEIGL